MVQIDCSFVLICFYVSGQSELSSGKHKIVKGLRLPLKFLRAGYLLLIQAISKKAFWSQIAAEAKFKPEAYSSIPRI